MTTTPKRDLRTGRPVWQDMAPPRIDAPPLRRDCRADVLVIGAGITGAMAAQAIAALGLDVLIIDRRGPLQGATAATTALLQYEIDTPLTHLAKTIGEDRAARAWRRSRLAIESLAAGVAALNIACGLKRRRSLYLAGNLLDPAGLKAEARARAGIGLRADYLPRGRLAEDYGIDRPAALVSHDNLSANPLRLAAGFLRRAMAAGARIRMASAGEIQAGRDGVRVETPAGPVISARHLVFATGYEMPEALRSPRFALHSTYAIATRPQPEKLWPDAALIWEASDPYLYLRSTADGRVICGGEDELFQDAAARDALLEKKTGRLEAKLHALFPQLDATAENAWCGSFGASDTGLPGIGAVPGMPNCHAILAFGGNGITFGRIGAELIATTLDGGADPDADLFAF